jgi:hypothetical protein
MSFVLLLVLVMISYARLPRTASESAIAPFEEDDKPVRRHVRGVFLA